MEEVSGGGEDMDEERMRTRGREDEESEEVVVEATSMAPLTVEAVVLSEVRMVVATVKELRRRRLSATIRLSDTWLSSRRRRDEMVTEIRSVLTCAQEAGSRKQEAGRRT